MSEPRHPASGVYARIRVRPGPDCVVRRLSEDHIVRQYTPGTPNEARPQVVVEPAVESTDDSLTDYSVDEIIWLGDRAVCLLRHPDGLLPTQALPTETEDAGHSTELTADREMTLYGFDGLPVAPFVVRLVDGWLELHLVTTAYSALRETVSELREAPFDVDLRQVVQSDRSPAHLEAVATLSTVDRSMLTDRQHEVATVALEAGYFETEGATAAEIADTLGISKSTLSEHLRAVINKLLSQIFP